MAIYEIDLTVATCVRVEIEARSAREAWEQARALQGRNALEENIQGQMLRMFIQDIDQVREQVVAT